MDISYAVSTTGSLSNIIYEEVEILITQNPFIRFEVKGKNAHGYAQLPTVL